MPRFHGLGVGKMYVPVYEIPAGKPAIKEAYGG